MVRVAGDPELRHDLGELCRDGASPECDARAEVSAGVVPGLFPRALGARMHESDHEFAQQGEGSLADCAGVELERVECHCHDGHGNSSEYKIVASGSNNAVLSRLGRNVVMFLITSETHLKAA